MLLGVKLRVGFIALIYKKMLRLKEGGPGTTGKIVNIISNDVQRFEDLGPFLPSIFSVPVEIVVSTIFISTQIAESSLMVLVALFLYMLIQASFGRLFGRFRRITVRFRDERVRTISDMLAGILVVKLYSWEKPFTKQVEKERKSELHQIKKSSLVKSCNEAFYFSSTTLIPLFPFITFYLLGGILTPSAVFSSINVISNLKMSLSKGFAGAVQFGSEALISLERITEFLLLEEIELNAIALEKMDLTFLREKGVDTEEIICLMKNASFKWTSSIAPNEDIGQNILSDIDLTINKGKLLGVCGPVGSGKSSFASALLGEMDCTGGMYGLRKTVKDPNGETRKLKIAYCSQIPWIISGTIKDNILFSETYNEDWFKVVISACELERDIESFPEGVETLIGERGVLDDPLSAVDAKVGRNLFENCLKNLLLSSNTYGNYRKNPASVVLITHQLQYIKFCEEVLVLINGKINSIGKFEDAVNVNTTMRNFLTEGNKYEVEESDSSTAGEEELIKENPRIATNTNKTIDIEDKLNPEEKIEGKKDKDKELSKELTEAQGSVNINTYINFFKSGVHPLQFFLLVAVLICGQVSSILGDWSLSNWANESAAQQKASGNKHASIYSGLVCLTFLLSFLRSGGFFLVCLKCSRSIFLSMTKGVMRSPLYFFEVNPHGRILNRFSKDLSTVDELLPPTFFDFIQASFQIFAALVLSCVFIPPILIGIPFVIGVFFFLRKYYISSSTQIKRIESAAKSPIYANIPTTMEGLTTLRAFGAQERSITVFNNLQNKNTRFYFAFISCSRWLGLRLDWLSGVFFLMIVLLSVFLKENSKLGASSVGLVLTYALQMLGSLQWGTRQSAEVENQMVCVERMLEYTKLTPEADEETKDVVLPSNWPDKGDVKVDSLSLIYPGTTHKVLNNISIHFEAGKKIGVVGRTGAGKSSLLQALFRLVEPSEGNFIIDGINTSKIGLKDLRSRISIIPQEPFCFKGTLRFNIDPFGKYTDDELWTALEAVELKKLIEGLPQKMESPVSEGGSNWSVGERQLICLARAILRNTRLIVMDEATSNVDLNTDQLIQNAIRSKSGLFANSTVLTIAHRLNTVIDFDKIMVLDFGKVVEYDTPYQMLIKDSNDPGAWFRRMVDEMGEEAKISLLKIAKQKNDLEN
ncbi:hypothetical protein HK099_007873 [Clydaea vesicula]|uniref:Uncharacterized protein n=1 Tax=Clydaea vesicula TaxID=447962 RepID=A0AAD5TYI1_9FUNG|nr:hypothetical protein HK099_007873 [Clydaea vesicula]